MLSIWQSLLVHSYYVKYSDIFVSSRLARPPYILWCGTDASRPSHTIVYFLRGEAARRRARSRQARCGASDTLWKHWHSVPL